MFDLFYWLASQVLFGLGVEFVFSYSNQGASPNNNFLGVCVPVNLVIF